MAYGAELFLGFVNSDATQRLMRRMGVELTGPDSYPTLVAVGGGDKPPLQNKALQEAHAAACAEMGWELIKPMDHLYITYELPFGKQELAPFALEYCYDREEMGDDEEDAVFGVAVTGRYRPTFVDWREPHGGSGNAVVLDTRTLTEMEIAKKHIVAALPEFADAVWIVKQKHY